MFLAAASARAKGLAKTLSLGAATGGTTAAATGAGSAGAAGVAGVAAGASEPASFW